MYTRAIRKFMNIQALMWYTLIRYLTGEETWFHQCSVFFCMRDSLQPRYPFRFEVDKIDVCPMALQPLDCRAVHCQLAVYTMALQPLKCHAVQDRVAEMPPETAHPIFPQCNRSRTAATTVRTAATTVRTVATLPLAVHPTRDNR